MTNVFNFCYFWKSNINFFTRYTHTSIVSATHNRNNYNKKMQNVTQAEVECNDSPNTTIPSNQGCHINIRTQRSYWLSRLFELCGQFQPPFLLIKNLRLIFARAFGRLDWKNILCRYFGLSISFQLEVLKVYVSLFTFIWGMIFCFCFRAYYVR